MRWIDLLHNGCRTRKFKKEAFYSTRGTMASPVNIQWFWKWPVYCSHLHKHLRCIWQHLERRITIRNKLHENGIKGRLLNWIINFLQDRSSRCFLEKTPGETFETSTELIFHKEACSLQFSAMYMSLTCTEKPYHTASMWMMALWQSSEETLWEGRHCEVLVLQVEVTNEHDKDRRDSLLRNEVTGQIKLWTGWHRTEIQCHTKDPQYHTRRTTYVRTAHAGCHKGGQ